MTRLQYNAIHKVHVDEEIALTHEGTKEGKEVGKKKSLQLIDQEDL